MYGPARTWHIEFSKFKDISTFAGMTDVHALTVAEPTKLKYLDLLGAIYSSPGSDEQPWLLESVEQRLLEFITVRYVLNDSLSMMQILTSRDVLFLGASTISRKVDALRAAGWIRSVTDTVDRRVKFIEPTPKAMAYFERINALMPE
jgi:DNA-binding MarR family transcriptional regulator